MGISDNKSMNQKLTLITIMTLLSTPALTWAQNNVQFQNRVNLEDVKIQGEANKNGAMFLNRNKFDLDERVKIRRNFRREIEQNIPPAFDQLPAETVSGK
ncbi:MAG: hypothetical protein COT73_03755 [Bdellovibrio sp. CG10_big_fil_rev_8_21_14_0_10_47_8]|nr:MAG: hypothetical protein COT73_03755 [Bdellovibrio sp. CG10_big_fil_rev_8_21_14_0_10_47_8]